MCITLFDICLLDLMPLFELYLCAQITFTNSSLATVQFLNSNKKNTTVSQTQKLYTLEKILFMFRNKRNC